VADEQKTQYHVLLTIVTAQPNDT